MNSIDQKQGQKQLRYNIVRRDFEELEKEFREVDTLYNIMVINMAYVEIKKYKFDKYVQYSKMMKECS